VTDPTPQADLDEHAFAEYKRGEEGAYCYLGRLPDGRFYLLDGSGTLDRWLTYEEAQDWAVAHHTAALHKLPEEIKEGVDVIVESIFNRPTRTTTTLVTTQSGAFFLYHAQWHQESRAVQFRSEQITREAARKWLMETELTLYGAGSAPFDDGDPVNLRQHTGFRIIYDEPEGIEGTACVALYARMSISHKGQLEAAAKAAGVPLRALVESLIEEGLARRREIPTAHYSG